MINTDFVKPLCQIAKDAGAIIMQFYEQGAAVNVKEDKSPVTEADIATNEFIVNELQKIAPDIPIVAEESENAQASAKAPCWWLVDPLDGTKSFIKRTGEFTVNIGLIDNNVPSLGVIYVPVQDTLYFVGEDMAAYRQVSNGQVEKISVRMPPAEGLAVVASQSHRTPETDAFIDQLDNVQSLMSASSSLKLCLIAEGQADVYPRFGPTCEWDIAAGHAILRAAGGVLTDEVGQSFNYGKPHFRNGYFIAWGYDGYKDLMQYVELVDEA